MGARSEKVDAYIARQADFARPILQRLREQFHRACPDIEETIKWGVPYFVKGGLVGGTAGFKRHVTLGFWKQKVMQDPHGLFGPGSGSTMSALKFSSLDELPPDGVICEYIREAVRLNEAGVKVPVPKRRARDKLDTPPVLAKALRANPAAATTFESFSYSHRRDYVEWISEAKQTATRDRRLAQAIEWLAEGKPRNWKYMKKKP